MEIIYFNAVRKAFLLNTLILLFSFSLCSQESFKNVVNTLKERITFSAYVQLGYTYNSLVEPANTFDFKRIIFMADGKITERWSCYFMYDFVANAMQEVYTDYHFLSGVSVRLGQFKTPYTMENQLPPTTVELINCYSLPVCYLAAVNGSDAHCSPNGGRDIGLMIYGDLFMKLFFYKLALMNGQSIIVKDRNNRKDIVGYLTVNPPRGHTFGGSFSLGEGHSMYANEAIGIRPGENYRRNRWSVGAVFTGKCAGLRGEFLAGKDKGVKSNGCYATGYVQLIPNVEAVASVEYLNRNTGMDDTQTNYMGGLQYWFYPKCRLQAQYTRMQPNQDGGGNLFQAQVQVRF